MRFYSKIYFVLCLSISADRIRGATRLLSCPFSQDLIGKDTLDQYDLVYVTNGDDLVMPCCQRYPSATKTWYRRDRFSLEPEIVLEAGLAKISDTFELAINHIKISDTGTYYCQDPWFGSGNSTSNVNNYYYLIDLVLKSAPISYGNIEIFQRYLRTHIVPLARYLRDYGGSEELRKLYEKSGLILEVDLRFDEWSDCDACKREKQRVAHCHIQPHLRDAGLCGSLCHVYKFALHMDCRSIWTISKILPALAKKTKDIPDFGKIVKCVGVCSREALAGVSYVKKLRMHDLAVGANLMLVCPGSAIHKQCFWRRDGNRIYSTEYEPNVKVSVNEFATLSIEQATSKESANYSCYVDNVLVTQNKVRVIQVFSEKNASWWRHIKYLQYIVLVCFVILLGGLATAIIQRRNFQTIDVTEAAEKYLKRKFDHEKLQPPSSPSPSPTPTYSSS